MLSFKANKTKVGTGIKRGELDWKKLLN